MGGGDILARHFRMNPASFSNRCAPGQPWRRLLALCTWGLGFLSMSCQSHPGHGIKVSAHTFRSGGRTIQVDRYRGQPGQASAAVLVLHGAGGMIFDGPEMKRLAQALAHAGLDAYVVHYFDRAGGPVAFDGGMTRHFDTWVGTVRDAVTWVRETEGQKGPLGLFGYSLGGFLTVAESSHDPRIAAAAVHAGGIWEGYDKGVTQVPPMLVIHGRQDSRVEFDRYVPELRAFVLQKGGAEKLESALYDSQGHRFDAFASAQVRGETVAFFTERLRSSAGTATAKRDARLR